jgi:hypothetical protein
MSTETVVSNTAIAEDFRAAMQGKLDDDKIAAAVAAIETTTGRYPATGSVASLIFYLKVQVNITGGKTFNGEAGGLFSPGGGFLAGDVYTDDVNRLYRDTVSFAFEGTPVYLSVQFFDAHSNLLGHLQAGAVSIVIGIGGGSGRWS